MNWNHTPIVVVRNAVAAMNDGNLDGYLAAFDGKCLRFVVGYPQPLTLVEVGDGLRELATAFEGLYLHEDLLFGDERYVCARWRMRGLHTGEYLGVAPSGRTIDIETCEVYQVADDRVVASWTYGDLLGDLIKQLGVAPALETPQ